MSSEQSKQICEQLINKSTQDDKVGKIFHGHFGAYRTVSIENDGPVKLIIDSKGKKPTEANSSVASNIE